MEMHHSMQERKRVMKNEKRKAFNDLSQRYGNKKRPRGILGCTRKRWLFEPKGMMTVTHLREF